MDSANDLSSLRAYTHYLPVGIRVWAPPQLSLVREPSDLSSTAVRPRCGVSYSPVQCCLIWICLHFTGLPHTVQEYIGVGVQSLAYLGFRPADGLSAMLEGWTSFVSDNLGGVHPNQVYTTLEIRACSFTLVHPCRED